ncbi:hypothetical protein E2562_007086 [Oryza meyeriana var. granulata]|uniref:Uncharacterized protein n=1 Tax=Oryza meyeriana var. granulata TaxID=110450 RepID=A0A6G1F4U8_9ORYZ|nr:hypothetical protein E2562_007086 [Oryza meyeriana var. granulata]
MADFGHALGWTALHSGMSNGFNEQFHRLMWCLRYLSGLVYRGWKFEFVERDEWEAEYVHHPYRGKDDHFCTVRCTPCFYNLIVTYLSHWVEAVDDCYEEAPLELVEQKGCLGDLKVDHLNLTHTFQQLEEEH